jgi:hypothetical protein
MFVQGLSFMFKNPENEGSQRSSRKRPSEPPGWTKVRIPTWLKRSLEEMAAEMLDSRMNRGGKLPNHFVKRKRVPLRYVIARTLANELAHRSRSTKGEHQRKIIDQWVSVAKSAHLPPYGEDDSEFAHLSE